MVKLRCLTSVSSWSVIRCPDLLHILGIVRLTYSLTRLFDRTNVLTPADKHRTRISLSARYD